MMSGKAMERSFLRHLLVIRCLTQHISAEVVEDESDFDNCIEEPERLYTEMEAGEIDLDTLM